jgi:hypothetical protein
MEKVAFTSAMQFLIRAPTLYGVVSHVTVFILLKRVELAVREMPFIFSTTLLY